MKFSPRLQVNFIAAWLATSLPLYGIQKTCDYGIEMEHKCSDLQKGCNLRCGGPDFKTCGSQTCNVDFCSQNFGLILEVCPWRGHVVSKR